mmetsp:Transcript_4700/g.13162  ORF Transcript_4700/g.13162 Transcript_4700/m.13162 type:complete len:209 (+) Transcript_4700:516-1142(+)
MKQLERAAQDKRVQVVRRNIPVDQTRRESLAAPLVPLLHREPHVPAECPGRALPHTVRYGLGPDRLDARQRLAKRNDELEVTHPLDSAVRRHQPLRDQGVLQVRRRCVQYAADRGVRPRSGVRSRNPFTNEAGHGRVLEVAVQQTQSGVVLVPAHRPRPRREEARFFPPRLGIYVHPGARHHHLWMKLESQRYAARRRLGYAQQVGVR